MRNILLMTSMCALTAACSGILDIGSFGDKVTSPAEDRDPTVDDPMPEPDDRVGDHMWSRAYGATNDDGAAGIAMDSAGALFIGGAIEGTVTLGDSTHGEANQNQLFVARLDAEGGIEMAHSTGGSATPTMASVAVAPNGAVAIVGSFSGGSITFDDETEMVSIGQSDAFFASYAGQNLATATGTLHISGTNNQHALGVAATNTGFVVVGSFWGQGVKLGEVAELNSEGGRDGFAIGINPNGEYVWQLQAGATGQEAITAVAAGPDNTIIAGTYSGNAPLDELPPNMGGLADVFVATLTSSGAVDNAVRFGETGAGEVTAIAAANDHIAIAGSFTRTFNFDGLVLTSGTSQDDSTSPDIAKDVFVVLLDPALTPIWAHSLGARGGDDSALSVAIDADGDVVVAGALNGGITFMDESYPGAGGDDAFVCKLDGATGAPVWAKAFGRNQGDHVFGITIDSANNILVAGDFQDGFIIDETLTKGSGGADIFVTQFSP